MTDAPRNPLEQLTEEFVARLRRGERPSVAEYADRHPDLADEIRDLFPAVLLMEEVGSATDARSAQPSGRTPDRLGDYRIVRELGRGGMGVVYEAEQSSLGRRVALKVLPPAATLDGHHLRRFRREAAAAAKLHHTNIVPVFGVGESAGVHYYAMQFIPGWTLRQLLRTEPAPSDGPGSPPPLPEGDARFRFVARIGVQVAEALAYAHDQGVLHRDVKPANLILDPHGTVWVTDFGLAKAEGAGELTGADDVVGTVRYMAPERFDGRADVRGDVYGLGLTLYELILRRPAFDAADRAALVRQVLHEEPPRPRAVNRLVPRDLETILLKATAKDPGERYQTAAGMADDLRRFIDGRPITARPTGLAERVVKWVRRHPAAAAAYGSFGLAVVLGALGAGAVWLWRDAAVARDEAAEQRRLAEDAHARETGLRADLARLDGIRQVDLAHRDWLAGDVAAGLGRLERAARAPGKGWEWGYVYHLYHGGFTRPPIPAGRGSVQEICLSRDGRFLAARWGLGPVRTSAVLVWDGEGTAVRLTTESPVTGFGFGPDGSLFLGTEAGAVEQWEVPIARRVAARRLQDSSVQSLAVGPDGRTIATTGGTGDGVAVWGWPDGRPVRRFPATTGPGGVFAVTRDWTKVAAPIAGDEVKVWDARSGVELLTLSGLAGVTSLEFDPAGRVLAGTAQGGFKVWVRDTADGREVFEHRLAPLNPTLAVGFDPDRRLLFAEQNVVRAVDTRSGRVVRTFRGPAGHVNLFATGGGKVAGVEWYRQPYVWSAADPEGVTFSDGRPPGGVAVRPGTGELAVQARDRTVHLRDPATGRLVRAFADHPADATAVAFNPTGRLLAVGCADGTVRVCDPDTGRLMTERRWSSDRVTALAFGPDGRLLASAGTDRAVRVWDPRTGATRREWPDVPPWPVALAFSPDGRRLSAACGNVLFDAAHRANHGAVRVFDVESGEVRGTARDPDLAAMVMEFAPGGRRLYAVGAVRSTIDVWDPTAGVRTMAVSGPPAFRLAFTPDGARYATAQPGRVRVWDAASDQECLSLRLPNPADAPLVLAFGPDGRRLVVGCRSGVFHVFGAPPPPGDPPPVRSPAAAPGMHGGPGIATPN